MLQTIEDLGYERQLEYVDQAAQITGKAPIVMDSADILSNPKGCLKALCTGLGIPWDNGMLKWEAGSRETDGIWASHWYNRVIETTGFGKPEAGANPILSDRQQTVADESRPYYERLSALKISL